MSAPRLRRWFVPGLQPVQVAIDARSTFMFARESGLLTLAMRKLRTVKCLHVQRQVGPAPATFGLPFLSRSTNGAFQLGLVRHLFEVHSIGKVKQQIIQFGL